MSSHSFASRAKFSNREGGFTLVELAMVLFIISLTIVGIFGTASSLIQQAEDRDTLDKVSQAKERINGFAMSNQRLPLYASNSGTDEITALVSSFRDFWGRKLVYIYDPAIATSINGLASTICAKKTTALEVKHCTNSDCSTYSTQTNVAYLIFSTGRNLLNQTGSATTPHTESIGDLSYSGPDGAAGAVKTVSVNPTGNSVGLYSSPTTNPQTYDDVVSVVTLDELRSKVGCQGPQLRIVNSDLPMGSQSTAYNVSIYADGGIPVSGSTGSYRWCAETSLSPVSVSSIVTLEALGTGTSTVTLASSGGCSTAIESTWIVGDTLRVRGAGAAPSYPLVTTAAGTYDITVYVRDDQNPDAAAASTTDTADNIVFRKFVLGISGP